jgi:hypothetical protein
VELALAGGIAIIDGEFRHRRLAKNFSHKKNAGRIAPPGVFSDRSGRRDYSGCTWSACRPF